MGPRRVALVLVLVLSPLTAAANGALPGITSDLAVERAAEVSVDLARLGSARPDETLGEILIPRLGLTAPILEGVDDVTIRRGVGHFPETPPLTADGNVALAAHRTSHFRPLRDVVVGDRVTVVTGELALDYVVEETVVVDPEDVWVLRNLPGRYLTLVTCYPFDHAGSAPHRFIVRARADATPRRAGDT